jgi:hypothetical protein
MTATEAAIAAQGEGLYLVGQYLGVDDPYSFDGDEGRKVEMPAALRLLVGGRIEKVPVKDGAQLVALTEGVKRLDTVVVQVYANGPYDNASKSRGKVTFKARGARAADGDAA